MPIQYSLCNLGIVPLRSEPNDKSELVSQLIYGECFTVTEQQKKWSRIRLAFDDYEGWIDNKQFISLSEKDYNKLHKAKPKYSANLLDYITDKQERLMPVPLGSGVHACTFMEHRFEGDTKTGKNSRKALVDTALLYLNSPYLWGGKTPFGIDCSGFTQMVYKINGYALLRDASLQAGQGNTLNFVEESEAGDLAFFDNDNGDIVHVGILLDNNYIIHAHGKVRIDRIDHTGIFNVDTHKYSHKLRIIKALI